jgi:molybdopterin converting factor subunit 1
MRINVLLFASYADALGGPTVAVEVPDGATVADLVRHLRALPGAAHLPARPLVAVNQAYARAEQRLGAADEVAVIPPVAGG